MDRLDVLQRRLTDERGRRVAWRVGTLLGVEIRVHATMLVLVAWIAWEHAGLGQGALEILRGLALIGGVFAFVLLHELGHAWAARRFGIATRDITLLPIGGISRLERMPDRPAQELAMALAGPAVNLVLAALIFALMALARVSALPDRLLATGSPILAMLLWINVSLAGFNLLPAFPTDGGRALRALLAMRLPALRATEIAATIGQAMAVLFAVVGVLSSPILVLIAFFLYFGAAQEAGWARLKATLAGVPLARVMITDFRSLHPGEPLSRAVALLLAGAPRCFPVLDDGRVAGVLRHEDVVAGLRASGPATPVEAVMSTDLEVVDEAAALERAAESARSGRSILVERGGELVGLLTAESIADLALLVPLMERPR